MKKVSITLLLSLISCGFSPDREPEELHAEAANSTMSIICDLWENRDSYTNLQQYDILSKLEKTPFIECSNMYVSQVRVAIERDHPESLLVTNLLLSGTLASGGSMSFSFRFNSKDPNMQFLASLHPGEVFAISGKLEHMSGQVSEHSLPLMWLSEISLSNESRESGVMIGLSDQQIAKASGYGIDARPFILR